MQTSDTAAQPALPSPPPDEPYPHYEYADVARLFSAVHTLALGQPKRSQRFFETFVEAGNTYGEVLYQYPAVRVEPLDFHYLCLQSLSVMGEPLVEDLTVHHGWRGIVWAAVLAMLAPNPAYTRYFEDALPRAPYNRWLVEAAIQVLQGQHSSTAPEFETAVLALRNQLQPLTLQATRLRPARTLELLLAQQEQVAAAYHARCRL